MKGMLKFCSINFLGERYCQHPFELVGGAWLIEFYVCFLGLLIGHRHSSNREGTLTEFVVSVPHEQP